MAKKNKKKNAEEQSKQVTPTVNVKELEDCITRAILKSEQIKEQQMLLSEQQETSEWQRILGQSKSKSNNIVVKKIWEFWNGIVLVFKVITFRREDAKCPRVTFNLLKVFLEVMFCAFEWSLYVIAIRFIIEPFYSGEWMWLGSAFLSFLFARLIRIAKLEVASIEDKMLLLSIVSTVSSVVAMIIAIIAIFM